MKRRLQALACLCAMLLAVRMMAQDATGGGASGGDTSGGLGGSGASGASSISGGSGDMGNTTTPDNSGNTNSGNSGTQTGGNSGTQSTTSGGSNGGTSGGTGTGDQNGTGTGAPETTPGGGTLFGPGVGTEGTGGSEISPGPSPPIPPGSVAPVPGTTPVPSATPALIPTGAGAAAQSQAPVTFSLPGGYGGAAPQSFTLGQGRLAKPPITFSFTVSQGYDDNVFNADANPKATPTPIPFPTPPLEARIVGFRISPPSPPTPIIRTFRPQASPTPTPPAPQLGVIGSPVSTATLGVQIQRGSPRTILTLDASLGAQEYWNQPGTKTDYNGALNMAFVHRLTPRATLSFNASAVYQQTPNFALINAPTNNQTGGSYLNGSAKLDLTYLWSGRLSTVTSLGMDANLLESNASSDLYEVTYGTQFRYSVSARNTITAELRQTQGTYPSNAAANSTTTYYLFGLDSYFSSRLRNTVSGGLEFDSYASGNGGTLPYVESATSLALPRGASLVWTNRYGSEASQDPAQHITSYRTGLTYNQPLSTKLVASLSVAYNNVGITDSSNSAGAFTQKQFQGSLSLNYTLTPRFSLSLSYTYIDFLTTQVNQTYTRNQTFLGGSYMFR